MGGVRGTSNVLAGKLFGIPVRGTHAHSWVMAFADELEAFEAYARALPEQLRPSRGHLRHASRASGTPSAAGLAARSGGTSSIGIRLDSGDLAYLSIEARRMPRRRRFKDAKIVASNDLDEHLIASLKEQGATHRHLGRRHAPRHGRRRGRPRRRLQARRGARPGGAWQHRVKVSEQAAKTSNPGVQQVRRFSGPAGFVADVIFDEDTGLRDSPVVVDPLDPTRRKRIPEGTPAEDLLVPVVRGGRPAYEPPPIEAARSRARDQIGRLHPGNRRFVNPHQYPVGLALELHELKTRLVLEARGV